MEQSLRIDKRKERRKTKLKGRKDITKKQCWRERREWMKSREAKESLFLFYQQKITSPLGWRATRRAVYTPQQRQETRGSQLPLELERVFIFSFSRIRNSLLLTVLRDVRKRNSFSLNKSLFIQTEEEETDEEEDEENGDCRNSSSSWRAFIFFESGIKPLSFHSANLFFFKKKREKGEETNRKKKDKERKKSGLHTEEKEEDKVFYRPRLGTLAFVLREENICLRTTLAVLLLLSLSLLEVKHLSLDS